MKKITLISILIILMGTACQQPLLTPTYTNDPVGNFEAFWNDFDLMYGLFAVKDVNWDEVYEVYRPQINENTTDEELHRVLVEMLQILDDGHTVLIPVNSDLPQYFGGPIGRIDTVEDFDLDILTQSYLQNPKETDFAMRYDYLEDGIGYVHIYGFGDGERAFDKEMAIIMEAFQDAKGLIIDIRGGYGGEDIAGKTVAGYFTEEKKLYMTNRIKVGPGWNNLSEPVKWYIEPQTEEPFTRPVILLTNRLTISARETFVLAMGVLPQVITIGDTTAGAFSNNLLRELPNGWAYALSIGDWRAADGTSYEGQGIPPEIVIKNRREDVLNGKDEVLERAIEMLK